MRNEAGAVCPWCGILSSHQTRVCCEAKIPRNATPYVGFLFRCYSDPVDHEGEVLESYVTKRRDRKAALKFIRKSMKRYGNPEIIVTDKLRSYAAAMKVIGISSAI